MTPINFGLSPIGRVVRRSSASTPTYAEVLRDTYGASEIFPLVDIASGTNISAFINSDRNGTAQGWDWQNGDPGAVPGTKPPYSDGVNDYGNILTSNGSTGLVDIFDGGSMSGFMFGNLDETWNTSTQRYLFILEKTSLNRVAIYKPNTADTLRLLHRTSGSGFKSRTISTSFSDSGNFSCGFSSSSSDDELKLFINGSQVGATLTDIGTWLGGNLVKALIGSFAVPVSNVFKGWMSYTSFKFGSIWSPADFLAMHNAAATSAPDVP